MKTLFIVNDPPYGTERAFNALRSGRMSAPPAAADRARHRQS